MIIYIIILLSIAEFFRSCANYINRILKNNNLSFWILLLISTIATICSNIISFSTMFYIGKKTNIILLQCMLILGSAISVIFVNKFILKEQVDTGSYVALFIIITTLIIHQLSTVKTIDTNIKKFFINT
jgi:hypothetical protein